MYTHAQVRGLTDFAVGVQRASDYGDVADLAYAAVRALVPGDVTRVTLSTLCYPMVREHLPMQREAREAPSPRYNPYGHEDPMYLARLRRVVEGAADVRRVADATAFERSRFYNEVWRAEGVRRSAAYYNPGRHAMSLVVNRAEKRDFSEAEVGLLEMVGRHVDAAVEALSGRNGGRLPVRGGRGGGRRPGGGALEPVQRFSWAACARGDGRILRCDEATRELLRACGGEQRAGFVSAGWMERSRERLMGRAGEPIRARANGREVRAYLAPIRGCEEEFTVSLVEDPVAEHRGEAERGERYGLTAREREVTRWLAEGKTNPEIAIILGISPLTAKKHVEKILGKLGVENRAAAVARWLE